MEDKTIIRILGTKYTIKLLNVADDKELATCDGYCDFTTHEIIIRKDPEMCDVGDYDALRRKNLRHEIIHAFMGESGLQANFFHPDYGHDETTIDWFAIQYPKIAKIFKQLDIEN